MWLNVTNMKLSERGGHQAAHVAHSPSGKVWSEAQFTLALEWGRGFPGWERYWMVGEDASNSGSVSWSRCWLNRCPQCGGITKGCTFERHTPPGVYFMSVKLSELLFHPWSNFSIDLDSVKLTSMFHRIAFSRRKWPLESKCIQETPMCHTGWGGDGNPALLCLEL